MGWIIATAAWVRTHTRFPELHHLTHLSAAPSAGNARDTARWTGHGSWTWQVDQDSQPDQPSVTSSSDPPSLPYHRPRRRIAAVRPSSWRQTYPWRRGTWSLGHGWVSRPWHRRYGRMSLRRWNRTSGWAVAGSLVLGTRGHAWTPWDWPSGTPATRSRDNRAGTRTGSERRIRRRRG